MFRGNHLSNTTCLTHVFFKSGEYFGVRQVVPPNMWQNLRLTAMSCGFQPSVWLRCLETATPPKRFSLYEVLSSVYFPFCVSSLYRFYVYHVVLIILCLTYTRLSYVYNVSRRMRQAGLLGCGRADTQGRDKTQRINIIIKRNKYVCLNKLT